MANPIRPEDLPPVPALTGSAALIVDTGTGVYKATPDELLDAADGVTATALAAPGGSALSGFLQTGTGAVTRNVEGKLQDAISILDFIPVNLHAGIKARTDVTELSAYFEAAAAAAAGKCVIVPAGLYNAIDVDITTANVSFVGEGEASVVRAANTTGDLFHIKAAAFRMANLRLEGIATDIAEAGGFAVFTDAANPAPHMEISNVTFSGTDASHGFHNAIKIETGSDYAKITACTIERLVGKLVPNRGYGVLVGGATGVMVDRCLGYASNGRGRHFVYFSAGASYCTASGNYGDGWSYETYTMNCTDAQPAAVGNMIIRNTARNSCTASSTLDDSAISIFGNCQLATIALNCIEDSNGCGIKLDGTTSVNLKQIKVHANQIARSKFIGIDFNAVQGGSISANDILESSLTSAGVHANIRLVAGGGTATKDITVTGNNSRGPTYSRASFQLNNTAPAPSGLKVMGNNFPQCNLTAIELSGVVCPIDGRIRYNASYNLASLANGASLTSGFTVNGAETDDLVLVTLLTSNADGILAWGYVGGTNSVSVTFANLSGATKDVASTDIIINVFKALP